MKVKWKRILVLGATGFIGRNIVEMLLDENISEKIVVLVRNKSGLGLYDTRLKSISFDRVITDEKLSLALKNVDCVINAAGKVGDWRLNFEDYYESNYFLTKRLVVAMGKRKIKKFIHISSPSVTGVITNNKPGTETDPYNPSNIYEYTKTLGELYVRNHCKAPWVIIRPEFVYGPGDTHVLQLYRAVKHGRFAYIGGGRAKLHPTYIGDVTEAVKRYLLTNKADFKIVIVTGPKPLSIREMVGEIRTVFTGPEPMNIPIGLARAISHLTSPLGLFGLKPVITPSQIDFFSEDRYFSPRSTRKLLNYQPRISYHKGLLLTKKWCQEKKLI